MLNINKKDIEGIYLLSVEEAQKIPKWILASTDQWWLQSNGLYYNYIATVGTNGSIYHNGYFFYRRNAVRPALRIANLNFSNLEIGETVKVLGRLAQYVGGDSVLLCKPIGKRRFDEKSNDYETSEIKSYLDDWFEKKRRDNVSDC